jgi:hypothetical protein
MTNSEEWRPTLRLESSPPFHVSDPIQGEDGVWAVECFRVSPMGKILDQCDGPYRFATREWAERFRDSWNRKGISSASDPRPMC